jgi:hypothetical protein
MKLTPAQRDVLEKLADSGTYIREIEPSRWPVQDWNASGSIHLHGINGYFAVVHFRTMASLKNKGLICMTSKANRRGEKFWRISKAGRRAILPAEVDDGAN